MHRSMISLVVMGSVFRNAGDGIEFDENTGEFDSTGDLDGTVEQTTASHNTGAGLRADQGGAGAGTLKLVEVTTLGNVAGAVVVNTGVTVIQTPERLLRVK